MSNVWLAPSNQSELVKGNHQGNRPPFWNSSRILHKTAVQRRNFRRHACSSWTWWYGTFLRMSTGIYYKGSEIEQSNHDSVSHKFTRETNLWYIHVKTKWFDDSHVFLQNAVKIVKHARSPASWLCILPTVLSHNAVDRLSFRVCEWNLHKILEKKAPIC